ncbi:hypothetical protein MTO96_048602 [Rhipicephalus appendiculatus]
MSRLVLLLWKEVRRFRRRLVSTIAQRALLVLLTTDISNDAQQIGPAFHHRASRKPGRHHNPRTYLKPKSNEGAGGSGRIRCGAMGSPLEHHATTHLEDASPPEQVVDGVSSRPLPLLMAAGLVTGAALGFAICYTDNPWTKRQIVYVGFPGELFLRMMSGVTLPLISTSVVAALGSSRPPALGRVGLCALALSLACKCLAAAGALGLAAFLSPGNTVRLDAVETPWPNTSLSNVAIDRLLDFIRNLFPSNIIAAHIYTA